MTPDDRALAAELVLGLLDDSEHAAARARTLTDPAFAAEVTDWQEWLMPLTLGWPEEAPPPTLEPRVMAAIAAPLPGAAPRNWGRRFAFAAMALAAAVLALVLGPLRAPPPVVPPVTPAIPGERPTLLAALAVPADQQAEGRAALAAAVDDTAGVVRVSPVAGLPAQRSAELWAIGANGAAPVALGLLAADGPSRVTVPAAARRLLVPGTTLAVSVEPVGGSRTGAPTGPVVAAGALARG